MKQHALAQPAATDLNLADVIDVARMLPPAREAATNAEMRMPVVARDGSRVLVTFRRANTHGEDFPRCWWQPVGL